MSVFESEVQCPESEDVSKSLEYPLEDTDADLRDEYEEWDVDSKTFNNLGLTFLSEFCGMINVVSSNIVRENLTNPVWMKIGGLKINIMSPETYNDLTKQAAVFAVSSLIFFIASSKGAIDIFEKDQPGKLLCD